MPILKQVQLNAITTTCVILAVCFHALAVLAADANPDVKTGEWVSLFNGKDLTGWTPKIRYCELGDNFGNTFRVEDGLMKVRYDGGGYDTFGERFGHLFFKDSFGLFKILDHNCFFAIRTSNKLAIV